MKNRIKLFEEFLKEEDPLAALGVDVPGEGEDKEKKKEDPIKKMQDEIKKRKEKQKENFEEFMDRKTEEAARVLEEMPDVKAVVGEIVIDALKSQDRIHIHNAVNELIYAQQKYQKAGKEDMVHKISRVKVILDELDRSFTTSKFM
jgi:hypothetical protein